MSALDLWIDAQHEALKRETARQVRSAKIMTTKAFDKLDKKYGATPHSDGGIIAAFKRLADALNGVKV